MCEDSIQRWHGSTRVVTGISDEWFINEREQGYQIEDGSSLMRQRRGEVPSVYQPVLVRRGETEDMGLGYRGVGWL